jgi:hypothetical protein
MVKDDMGERSERCCRRTGENVGRINRRREVQWEAGAHSCHSGVDVARVDWVVVVGVLCRVKRGLRRLLKELQEKSTAVLRKVGDATAVTGGEWIRRCSAAFGHGLVLLVQWGRGEATNLLFTSACWKKRNI